MFNLSSDAAPTGGRPAAGTLTRAKVEIRNDATEKAGVVKVWFVLPGGFEFSNTYHLTEKGTPFFSQAAAKILEGAGETVDGNPRYEKMNSVQDVLRAIHGKNAVIETGEEENNDKTYVKLANILSPNPRRGTKDKWEKFLAQGDKPATTVSAPKTKKPDDNPFGI